MLLVTNAPKFNFIFKQMSMQFTGFLLTLHYFLLFNFQGVMDVHGSSFGGKGQLHTTTPGQSTMIDSYAFFEQETNKGISDAYAPNTSLTGTYNTISVGDNGVLNPLEGDVPHDPEAQRRALNRNYSKTYRIKKQNHFLKLEDEVKTLNEKFCITSSQLEYCKGIQSNLEAETNSLMKTFSEISSSLEAEQANPMLLITELMEVKQIDEMQQAMKAEMMKYTGK